MKTINRVGNIFNEIFGKYFSQNPLTEFEIERMFYWSDFGHFRVEDNIRVFKGHFRIYHI